MTGFPDPAATASAAYRDVVDSIAQRLRAVADDITQVGHITHHDDHPRHVAAAADVLQVLHGPSQADLWALVTRAADADHLAQSTTETGDPA